MTPISRPSAAPRLARPVLFSRSSLAAFAICAAAFAAQAQAPAAPAPAAAASAADAPLVSLKDKMSYSTGVMTARNLIKNGVPFDLDLLIQGLRDGIAGGPIRVSEKELKVVLQSMQADIQRKVSNERAMKTAVNRENGQIFQNDYRKKPGVTVLPGNLMYRVIREGKGDKPGESGTVVVKYRGTQIDGTEFEATPEGKTATFKLPDVISGWREALKRMSAGSIWELVVPPNLAYAARGADNVGIGPNETLVFTIELVAVVQ
jgi:FKBP-type peptidyl-prolyl cis-trans isomerase FklB